MKKGLVMEGGAMRGMFTCGVLDVLMENGFTFDAAVGVSAGATFGCNIKSHQKGRALRYNKKYCADKRYHSLSSLFSTGDIYNVKFCYKDLPLKLDKWDHKTFKEDPMEFYCVATDVDTGRAVYHKCHKGKKEDLKWIRASASMPLVSRIVNIDGGHYLDGGISDSIPLKFMEKKGCDRILVIETQPADYVKGRQKYMPLVHLLLYRYPNMIKAMRDRYLMYNREKRYVKKREEEGKAFVIRPLEPLNISPIEKDEKEIERVYLLGREAANRCIPQLSEYFA